MIMRNCEKRAPMAPAANLDFSPERHQVRLFHHENKECPDSNSTAAVV
jgi:hypothetical protein